MDRFEENFDGTDGRVGGSASWEKMGGNKEGECFLDGGCEALQFQIEKKFGNGKTCLHRGSPTICHRSSNRCFSRPAKTQSASFFRILNTGFSKVD